MDSCDFENVRRFRGVDADLTSMKNRTELPTERKQAIMNAMAPPIDR